MQADWDLLATLGCKEAQGYLVAKPMPPEDLPNWLSNWPVQQQNR
jgi:EAL domain-containing protein (putative c-di-GMP-specific phosphodiesterase class I)